jgi:hypothetical protein
MSGPNSWGSGKTLAQRIAEKEKLVSSKKTEVNERVEIKSVEDVKYREVWNCYNLCICGRFAFAQFSLLMKITGTSIHIPMEQLSRQTLSVWEIS